jgi:integrase
MAYIADIEGGWKNPVHRKQWPQSLRDHAAPLMDMPINAIQTEHVLSGLKPIWLDKCETASRVRGRIEKILDAAKVRGLRPIDAINPAQWKGHLELLLPKQPKFTRGHHAALGWKHAPSFMVELRQRPAEAARALEFTILTAARSGEVLGATWSEIDFDEALWRIPAERMKAGIEHIVPLSSATMDVLRGQWARVGEAGEPLPTDAVFGVRGAHRSNMAMNQLLKRMGYEGKATTHGFRSTFRDWAGDATEYPREVIEQALAHPIGNKAEAAYRRGTALEKRRRLMEAWAQYLS